jgi:maleylpyruvate isomerase
MTQTPPAHTDNLILHTFAHSSASWRVRIGLALKGLTWTKQSVSLLDGSHKSDSFSSINPNQRVPALELGDGTVLTQSMAILAWLDETIPTPALLPGDPIERARCRAFASVIAEDIFPLQNLGVRQKLGSEFGADADRQAQWCADWIVRGFAGLEQEAARQGMKPGRFLFGNSPTLADICLVPQMRNAVRYQVDLTAFPLLVAARDHAMAHRAFADTAPETQPA